MFHDDRQTRQSGEARQVTDGEEITQIRHTAASWMRMSGADIHTVAELLGHKTLVTAKRYQPLSAGLWEKNYQRD